FIMKNGCHLDRSGIENIILESTLTPHSYPEMAVNSPAHFDKAFGPPAVRWNDEPLQTFATVKSNQASPINAEASFQPYTSVQPEILAQMSLPLSQLPITST